MFPQILKGVRVIDFSRLLPGPFASTLLQKMGAKVTCILPPVEDPLLGAYSPFPGITEGKEFRTFDLKQEKERSQVLAEVSQSTILLEGFRPGTMDRLGLGFEAVKQVRPDVLYVSIVGYPPSHPKYQSGAHDINFLVDAGLYSLLYPDETTTIPVLQLADLMGGFYAAFQILMEWIARAHNPEARHLEVSVVEGLELLGSYLNHESSTALLPMLTGGLARYHIYRTKDQKRIAVASLEPKFYQNLLGALSLKIQDETEEEIIDRLEKVFATRTLQEWEGALRGVDACLSFIANREEVLPSPLGGEG